MIGQLSWMVGGQQGDGFSSCGETFALGMNRLGYFIYGYFTNSSRILGGHANYRVRIASGRSRAANADEIDVLVAFDEETIEKNCVLLRKDGLILCDDKVSAASALPPEAEERIRIVKVPMSDIAAQIGVKIVKNMVAVGASAAIAGVEPDIFAELMAQRFARKGESAVAANVEAIRRGYEYVNAHYPLALGQLPMTATRAHRMLMNGNEAIGMGAVAAGCRAMYAYPITPATDIMEFMAKRLPKLGGIVLQTEDEIAAANMVIGSAYAGARAMTATSGPGLSLMMEAIGLSGMTETPAVIVNTQRGGPSTGLPTKHEQSDLLAALYGTHGEIPKIVLAPSTAEECYRMTVEAFHLAEAYQCPVILLTDTALSHAAQTVERIEAAPPVIDRGALAGLGAGRSAADGGGAFRRYELTDTGVSPRAVPGTPGGIHHVTGVEHDEYGRPSETAANRRVMMDKRLRKLRDAAIEDSLTTVGGPACELLLIGWGSSRGAIEEARERLLADGLNVTHVHIKALLPFPLAQLAPYLALAERTLVVENNGTGQLAALIRQHIAYHDTLHSLLKYNGEPFYPDEITMKAKELLHHGRFQSVSQ